MRSQQRRDSPACATPPMTGTFAHDTAIPLHALAMAMQRSRALVVERTAAATITHAHHAKRNFARVHDDAR